MPKYIFHNSAIVKNQVPFEERGEASAPKAPPLDPPLEPLKVKLKGPPLNIHLKREFHLNSDLKLQRTFMLTCCTVKGVVLRGFHSTNILANAAQTCTNFGQTLDKLCTTQNRVVHHFRHFKMVNSILQKMFGKNVKMADQWQFCIENVQWHLLCLQHCSAQILLSIIGWSIYSILSVF